MPRGINPNLKCKQDFRTNIFVLQPHQQFIFNYFLHSQYRGLLLYHRLGSGKTCTSILIANKLIEDKDVDKIYVISAGSLRQTWLTEYCEVCGKSEKELDDNFIFVTYNYKINVNNINITEKSLVIIDEVHNLINCVKNFSNRCVELYKKIYFSNARILALSGTPIYNNINEWLLLGNLLKPRTLYPNINNEMFTSRIELNEKLKEFKENYIIEDEVKIEVKQQLIENIIGIVSYFPGIGGDLYPEEIINEPFKINMTKDQLTKYSKAYQTEIRKKADQECKVKNGQTTEDKEAIILKLNIMTRLASNFNYPEKYYKEEYIVDGKKIEKKVKDTLKKKDIEKKKIFETKALLNKYLKEKGGWIDKQTFGNGELLNIYSPKILKLIFNIINYPNAKHMIYTFFKEKAGAIIIKNIFKFCGFPKILLYTGELNDTKRKSILSRFNDINNTYGQKYNIIIITEAGQEGITLKAVQHVHILESDYRERKIQQVIGRAIRYKSHEHLPIEKNKVNIWRYWSILPEPFLYRYYYCKFVRIRNKWEVSNTQPLIQTEGIDKILYERGQRNLVKINQFLEILKENSI